MRILIYEPAYTGHRLNFVRLLVPALAKLGADVVLATSQEATQSSEWDIQLRSLLADLRVDARLAHHDGEQINARVEHLPNNALESSLERRFSHCQI